MSTSSFRILLPSLAAFVMVSVVWPAVGRADNAHAPGTESSAGAATDAWLVTRGLIGHGMVDEQSGPEAMTPAPGVEVDETRQTENRTGEVLMQIKAWNEIVGDNTVHIEITTLRARNSRSASGCFRIIGRAARCTNGHSMIIVAHYKARSGVTMQQRCAWPGLPICHMTYIQMRFHGWRFCALLGAPRADAEGMLNQQITPYSYVGQDVYAEGMNRSPYRRAVFRTEDHRTSGHRDRNAKLAAFHSARHQAGNSQEHTLF